MNVKPICKFHSGKTTPANDSFPASAPYARTPGLQLGTVIVVVAAAIIMTIATTMLWDGRVGGGGGGG